MAFVVEDGTGVVTANAYTTTLFCDNYHSDRGNVVWGTTTQALKEVAIIKATDYIEQRWGRQNRFQGLPQYAAAKQSLSWPRQYVYDTLGTVISGVPTILQQATAEYALRALSAELYIEPVADSSGKYVLRQKEKVGPLETETSYYKSGGVSVIRSIPEADALVKTLLKNAGGGVYRS